MVKKNVLSRLLKLNIEKRSLTKLFVTAAVVLLAVSCRTVPQNAAMESSVSLLPEGSDVIIRADIDSNLELIEPILSLFSDLPPKLSAEFLERTDTIWAGLDFNVGDPAFSSGSAFSSSVVALGDYPASMIEWGLFWDSGWKKDNYKPIPDSNMRLPYWYEKNGSNQLAFPDDRYFLASSGEIKEMIENWSSTQAMPANPGWLESERRADITIMTRNLTPEDYGIFIPQFSKVPLKSLLLSLERIDDSYLISGRFNMDSEMSAFLFATLFRTMIISTKKEDGSRLFENPRDITIKKDGSDVVLEGMILPVTNVAAVEAAWLGAAGMKSVKE